MLLPILLLSAAGFTVLTTEFIIVGLLPSIARDLEVSVSQAGLLVTLFAFTVAALGPFLTAYFARFERCKIPVRQGCYYVSGRNCRTRDKRRNFQRP